MPECIILHCGRVDILISSAPVESVLEQKRSLIDIGSKLVD